MRFENKKVLPIIIILSFSILLVYLIFTQKPSSKVAESLDIYIPSKLDYPKTLTVGDNEIRIAIADDPEETRVGLSATEKLCKDCGMYFDLGYKNTAPTFWMKDMKFPIDIIWIDDGKVVEITKNVPAPEAGAKDYQLPRYKPSQKIDNVLEINAGYSETINIQVGDTVSIIEK